MLAGDVWVVHLNAVPALKEIHGSPVSVPPTRISCHSPCRRICHPELPFWCLFASTYMPCSELASCLGHDDVQGRIPRGSWFSHPSVPPEAPSQCDSDWISSHWECFNGWIFTYLLSKIRAFVLPGFATRYYRRQSNLPALQSHVILARETFRVRIKLSQVHRRSNWSVSSTTVPGGAFGVSSVQPEVTSPTTSLL